MLCVSETCHVRSLFYKQCSVYSLFSKFKTYFFSNIKDKNPFFFGFFKFALFFTVKVDMVHSSKVNLKHLISI